MHITECKDLARSQSEGFITNASTLHNSQVSAEAPGESENSLDGEAREQGSPPTNSITLSYVTRSMSSCISGSPYIKQGNMISKSLIRLSLLS